MSPDRIKYKKWVFLNFAYLHNVSTNVFASVLFCNNLFVYCDYVSLIFIFHKTERPTMVEFGGRKNGDTRMQNKQHGQQLDEVN